MSEGSGAQLRATGKPEEPPAFGRAASAAWRKAKAASTKLSDAAEKQEARRVLSTLVKALNRLHAKYDVDTLRREEAGDAFIRLASELGVEEEEAAGWFDEWRDF